MVRILSIEREVEVVWRGRGGGVLSRYELDKRAGGGGGGARRGGRSTR